MKKGILLITLFLLPLVLQAREPRVAPRFALADLSSRDVRLADLQGKVVLLGFWGTWVKPSLDGLTEMEALWGKYKARRLMVLGINEDEADNLEAVKKVALDRKTTYSILLDPTHAVRRAYGVEKLPCLILVDHHGIIDRVQSGFVDSDSLEAELQGLLAASEAMPTLSVGAVQAGGLSPALRKRVSQAIEEQVKEVRGYRLASPDDADFEITGSAAKVGKSVGLSLSLVDGRNRSVIKHATDSASESGIEEMVGRMMRELGLK